MDGDKLSLNGVLNKKVKIYYNDGLAVNRLDGIVKQITADNFIVLDDLNRKTDVFIPIVRIVRVELL